MNPPSDHLSSTFAPEWLSLREEADAEARSTAPLDPLRVHLTGRGSRADRPPLRIADLGCGTGSQGRWLAPRLPGPQSWSLYDLDSNLLDLAGASMPVTGADGSEVGARMYRRDLRSLTARDLAEVDLVTGSALLDLLSFDEVAALTRAVTGADGAALFTLSVTGRVELFPSDPADAAVNSAFNDHQRRRGALGPDAVVVMTELFERSGYRVSTFPSPWRLCPERVPLTLAWLSGRVEAAVEMEPGRVPGDYLHRRLAQCERGELGAVVHHTDLLALPPRGPESR